MTKKKLLAASVALAALSGLIAGCGGGGNSDGVELRADIYLLATGTASKSQHLVTLDLDKPDEAVTSYYITGLGAAVAASGSTLAQDAEYLLDIDYRNAEGSIYGLTDRGRIYLIGTSGIATLVSELKDAATDVAITLTPATVKYAVDFDPVTDRLRVFGSDGSNRVVDVLSGETTSATAVAANVTGLAHTDTLNASNVRTSGLYAINAQTGKLLRANGSGTLVEQADLGITAGSGNSASGYDIDPATGTGYAVLNVAGKTGLYRIDQNATSAAATLLGGSLPGKVVYNSVVVPTTANPGVFALASDNKLYRFTAKEPGKLAPALSVTGLAAGETLLGIDARQLDGTLYGLTSSKRVVSIDTGTGAISAGPVQSPAPAGSLTIDFDPLVPASGTSRLRVIASGGSGDNGLADIDTGTFTKGTATASAVSVVAAAYSNNYRATPAATSGGTAPTMSSTLFVINAATNELASQVTSNTAAASDTGALIRQASLGITVKGPVGLDISGRLNQNVLMAARTTDTGPLTLYRLATTSGAAATAQGQIGGSDRGDIVDIAIQY